MAEETPKKPLLCNAEIIRVSTDAEGYLDIKVELPDDALFNVNADVIGMAYLVGTITRFLGSLLENTTQQVLLKVQAKQDKTSLILPGTEN